MNKSILDNNMVIIFTDIIVNRIIFIKYKMTYARMSSNFVNNHIIIQIHTTYNILLSWKHKSPSQSQTAINKIFKIIVPISYF